MNKKKGNNRIQTENTVVYNMFISKVGVAFWKEMIAMRKSNAVLAEGDFTPLYEGREVYAFARTLGDKKLLSVCNMSGKTVKMPRKLKGVGKQIVSSYKVEGDALKPFEFRLYEI